MTLRAIITGFIGAVLINSLTYVNDIVMHQTFLIGNSMPLSVFGLLIIFGLFINPLLARIRPDLSFTGAEISVTLFIVLASCCIPGSGLMRHFTADLVMPFHWGKTDPAFMANHVTSQMPSYMLTNVTPQNESVVLNGFVQGLNSGKISFINSVIHVPWKAWLATFAFWMPFIIIFLVAIIGISAVVHRQWSDHEQLPYPAAAFATSLMPDIKSHIVSLYKNRIFWLGLAPVLLIHLNNYAGNWWPKYIIQVPTKLDFSPTMIKLFPMMVKTAGAWVFQPALYFSVIAIAFFLATDVSLAIGLAWPLQAFIGGFLLSYGISLTGGEAPNPSVALNMGAWFGFFAYIIYIGRHYYKTVFVAAINPRKVAGNYPESIWGARIFMLAILCFIIYASYFARLDWQITFLYTLAAIIIYVVLGRIMAETGFFMISPGFFPTDFLFAFLGTIGLGPLPAMTTIMFSQALLVDPRETLTPFLMTSMKLLDTQKVPAKKIYKFGIFALIAAMLVAVPVTLYFQYNKGANMSDPWATHWATTRPFYSYVGTADRLEALGQLERANLLVGWQKFANAEPSGRAILYFTIGAMMILFFTVARLKLNWWPVHPVIFLVMFTWPLPHFAPSFFCGWFIKCMVNKYGGGQMYQKTRPFMFGIIAGDMLAGIIIIIIGAVYYLATGLLPKSFYVLLY